MYNLHIQRTTYYLIHLLNEGDNMSNTILSIEGNKFLINNKLIYSEYNNSDYHGLLMNARFIQGVFDETNDVKRYNRFGKTFDPTTNTNELIEALKQWYDTGLRGITVGLQGGGPCFTVDNNTNKNHPFYRTESGMDIDQAYKDRLYKILKAADEIGMIVIVSGFYPGQVHHFKDGFEIQESVKAICRFINESKFSNIIYEICNEYDLCREHPLLGQPEGMASLIRLAQEHLEGNVPVGSSCMGGIMHEEVIRASDVPIIHGNGKTRQGYYRFVERTKAIADDKPIICNEDSQCIGNMIVSMKQGVSWGYYNNLTKQEPPTDWTITKGEDEYFAKRMALELGIDSITSSNEALAKPFDASNYYLQGIEGPQKTNNERFIRVSSLYPEVINYVEFFKNNQSFYLSYDEPFTVNYETNWKQAGTISHKGDVFKAVIHLADGSSITQSFEDLI